MIGGTQKQLTNFRVTISEEETECVDGVWFSLVIGERQDSKEVIELRTWRMGMLQDVVTDWFDRRVRENRLEADFGVLKLEMDKKKLSEFCKQVVISESMLPSTPEALGRGWD